LAAATTTTFDARERRASDTRRAGWFVDLDYFLNSFVKIPRHAAETSSVGIGGGDDG
jgi:hypothetical protein